MTIFAASLQKGAMQETQMKLKAIQKALFDFRIANNRIPCPADVTLALTDPNFAIEGCNARHLHRQRAGGYFLQW